MAEGKVTPASKQEEETRKRTWQRGPRKRTRWSKMWDRTGLRGKTLWGWLQLLIVPLVLALVGLWLTNATQSQQQMLEDQRAEAQWRIEEQRAQDAALQDYLGTMKEKLFGIF